MSIASTGLSRDERRAASSPLNPDDLPPDLRALWSRLPPRLKFKTGCDLRQVGRQGMYNKVKRGEIVAYKDGSTTLLDTLSILLDLARLPAFADAKSIPPHKRGKRTTAVADVTADRPKRGRRRKVAPEVDGAATDMPSTTSPGV